jgi:hypothetical protein
MTEKILENKKKLCEEIKYHYDICLLVHSCDRLIDSLQKILTYHNIKVWPNISYLFRNIDSDCGGKVELESCNLIYKSIVKGIIKRSKLIVAVITKEFSESGSSLQLVKYSQENNKPTIVLIIENIKNFKNIIKGIDCYFDLNKDGIFGNGNENYLWFGENFEKFLQKIEFYINKKFELEFVSYFLLKI